MRALVQRVHRASVDVIEDDGTRRTTGEAGRGLCVLVGATHDDGEDDATWLADKVANLRIFPSAGATAGLEVSCLDLELDVLVVSQFTLYGDTRKGRRPSFVAAASPEQAAPLVDAFVARLRQNGLAVATGEFGARMDVALVNDGPLTFLLETP